MPNWCGNVIEIKGEKVHLENLKIKIANGQNGSTDFMEYLIGLGDIPDNYDQDEGLDYNVERFGTKWDFSFSEMDLIQNEEFISISVESAWSPIIPFLQTLCQMYNVTATIAYEEPSCDFGGKAEIDLNGETYDYMCSYKEALYRFYNDNFWRTVKSDFEEKIYDDFDEMIQSLRFVSEEDKAKIELTWNANK